MKQKILQILKKILLWALLIVFLLVILRACDVAGKVF